MGEIIDYKCSYGSAGVSEAVTKDLNLEFPEAYRHWDSMVILAEAIKGQGTAPFCELPFCHTVEAEALGGHVNYGNEKVGPHPGEYLLDQLEEVMHLPAIDFESGRIKEVLLACRELRQRGEQVVLDVSGPFTILNVLMDSRKIFKALRRQPELMEQVFWKLGEESIRFIQTAEAYGVNMISYADSAGGVDVLGPKLTAQITETYTYPMLKKIEKEIPETTLIMLCPKITYALLGTKRAVFQDMLMPEEITYGEASIRVIGKTRFVGQTCMQNAGKKLEHSILKTIRLL